LRDYFFEKGQALISAEQVEISSEFRPLLELNSLLNLEQFMSVSRENAFRDVRQRLTVGLDLPDASGKTTRFYLKRHWLEKKKKSGGPRYEALSEWQNISRLAAEGINVPAPVATGSGYINGRPVAFMMVKEVPGIPADDYLREQFPQQAGADFKRKRKMIFQLAEFAARFHRAGYHHRDFYLCHTFVKEQGSGDYLFHLIDLQRVQHRNFLRARWLVKDLAQLNYSVPAGVSRTDCLRFFLTYSTHKRLTAQDKKQIRAVVAKTRRIARHDEKGNAK
jgi:hypothetical protein